MVNIQGSSMDRRPPEGESWIAYAESVVGRSTRCAALNCSGPAEEGAHVFVEGERNAFFIAIVCRSCNHRHGREEICYCRYITRRENPGAWIPIREDVMLCRIEHPYLDYHWEQLSAWCDEKRGSPSHEFRDRCSTFCSASLTELESSDYDGESDSNDSDDFNDSDEYDSNNHSDDDDDLDSDDDDDDDDDVDSDDDSEYDDGHDEY
jgi:hypothetical protein